ncbi:OmpA family protein [Leptospira sp. GIMC2001]|uniref:OmpA family protein n=1 Tax=Leptospira sp. GIMC2001 TaxID=1513297 RepID=UPI00234B7D4E|nr:OmpA family protein [Leptospira sp. GIMC2001]WCL50358.1 OmpA family protein [Leptospira sp. GIMC2001]
MQTYFLSIAIAFSILIPSYIFSDEPRKLEWKLQSDDVLELNEFHNVRFRVMDREVNRQDRNRIVLKVEECSAVSCRLDSFFDTYVRYGNTEGPFRKDKSFISKFFIQKNGLYIVPDEYVMPNLRSVPGFPESPVSTGDSWNMAAEESFDFIGGRVKIPVNAEYNIQGPREWKWNEHSGRGERINYSYSIYHQEKSVREGVPVKIYGFARGTVYFDPIRGVPQYKENKLSYTFVYPGGIVQEASFHINGVYQHRKTLTDQAKDDFRNQISNELGIPKDDSKSPLNVRRTDEGISISMDSILFDLDSADLRKDALDQIGKIAEVLKKYPKREIRISGHTDNTGGKDYNQKLSENRAKSALNALVDKFGLDPDRMSYEGLADRKPIASNKTEEERKKNRRVDITIVVE